MRKIINAILLAAMLLTFFACSKDNEESELSNSTTDNESKNTIDKIVGVWESFENDMFFISISSKGKISYCFCEYIMGIGYGTLMGRELVIENDYSGCLDKLDVNIVNETVLIIEGIITRKGTDESERIILSFEKVDEEDVYSFIGRFWEQDFLHVAYGWGTETLSFMGDNIAQYKRYTDKGKVLNDALCYYIPRKHHREGEMVYCHFSNSSIPYKIVVRDNHFSSHPLRNTHVHK